MGLWLSYETDKETKEWMKKHGKHPSGVSDPERQRAVTSPEYPLGNPGSERALAEGCLCPIFYNRGGLESKEGLAWSIEDDCPLHGHGAWSTEGAPQAATPDHRTVCQEADQIINGQRRTDYGGVKESFGRIAKLWSAALDHEVTAEQVGLCMVLLKVSRAAQGFQRDSLVDIAGYAGCIAKILDMDPA